MTEINLRKKICVVNTILFSIFIILSNAIFASDIIVDETTPTKAEVIDNKVINIADSKNGVSYNKFRQYSIGAEGVVINNSQFDENVDGFGKIKGNPNLAHVAKTILLEVSGTNRSELLGKITVIGDQANIILVNPNGITCQGSTFINTNQVELRTDKLLSITDGKANWQQDFNSDIHIDKNGASLLNGDLILSSGKIKIEGPILVKSLLTAEARMTNVADIKDEGEKYAIDINTTSSITAEKVYLTAIGSGAGIKISEAKFLANNINVVAKEGTVSITGINASQKGNVKIDGKKVDIKTISEAQSLVVHGEKIIGECILNDVKNVELIDGSHTMDLSITTPMKVDGDFKFAGRSFNNKSTFEVKNIELNLSGDFINDENGNITATGEWISVSKGFTNYQKINVEKTFGAEADTFINDKAGSINAGPIEIYLREKNSNGYSLYQSSNSVLESKTGGIEIIAPNGGMYFGYKKELTGAGDNKDGFKFIGSQLLSHGGPIHIQSGANVVFEGTQLLGDVTVEAKGEVIEKNLKDSYRNGTHMVSTIIDGGPLWETEEYQSWENTGCTPGCCGPWYKCQCCKVYGWVTRTRHKLITEHNMQAGTKEEAYFQEVILNANFAGAKQFSQNSKDLIFKESSIVIEKIDETFSDSESIANDIYHQ